MSQLTHSFKCIVNLLTFHQHVFVARLADLLPSVFPLVMHTSLELRHHAVVALASLSHTLITHRTLVGKNTIETICLHTYSFLTPETTRHPTSSRKLPPLLDAAMSSKNFGSMGKNSPWALTLVANFAILLGPSLFLHQGPLKLVMNTVQKALRHRPGRDLYPHVWRIFVWSMTELYIQRISTERGDVNVVKRCVLVLKQALHGGLGAALITSLLEATSADFQDECALGWVIPSVTDIAHDMLSSKHQDIRDEGCRMLGCLTRGVGPTSNTQRESNWITDALLSRFLFDGSLLRADKLQVEEIVRSTNIFSPRCLSQEEILTNWSQISSCFVLVVQNCFDEDEANLAVGNVRYFPMDFSFIYRRRLPSSLYGSPSYLSKPSLHREIVDPPPRSILARNCLPYFHNSSRSLGSLCLRKQRRSKFRYSRSSYLNNFGSWSRTPLHNHGSFRSLPLSWRQFCNVHFILLIKKSSQIGVSCAQL